MIKGVGDFFGLDIGLTGVRAVQLTPAGASNWTLRHFGYAPIDINIATANSVEARSRLGEVIMTVVGQSGIKTKNVAIGLPASKTFITVVDMPASSKEDLQSTIKYQLDQYIPMSIDEAKVDWSLLGQSLHDPSQQEVVLASTASSYAEDRLELVEELGFEVIAAEPDTIAMLRSVTASGLRDAQVIIDIDEQSINMAVVYADAPRLVRSMPNGFSTLVRAATQNLSIKDDQARQFILKFGLAPDKLEGQIVNALEATLEGFVSELTKSIKFFQARYPSLAIGGVSLVGYASAIPELDRYITEKVGIQAVVANPWQKVQIQTGDQRFNAVASEFAVAVGLAQRENKK